MTPAIFGLSGPALTADERAFFRDCDPAGYILFGRNVETRGQLRALFPEAALHAERVALLAKSWTATYVPSERGNLRADAGR